MQISVPFFAQKTNDACAPAIATARQAMLRTSRRHGFTCRMLSNATWNDLIDSLKNDTPVLIKYRELNQTEGRYALVIDVNTDDVTLHDPWNGSEYRLSVTELKKNWIGYHTKNTESGWMMTMMSHKQV